MNSIFENMMSQYSPTTKGGKDNATHEVMQQIALAGLYQKSCGNGYLECRLFFAIS